MPESEKPAATPAKKSNGDNDTLMGVLAYLGILFLIPLLAAKDSDFAQFHAKQGMTLFGLEVILYVVQFLLGIMLLAGGFGVFAFVSLILWLVWIGVLVLAIVGIVNVVNKKKEPLPVIGGINLMK